MRKLIDRDIREWCVGGGMSFHEFDRLGFPENERVIELAFPSAPSAISPMLSRILGIFREQTGTWETLLWIKETAIWDDRLEELGQKQLEILNAAMHGAGDQAPGYLFSSDENTECNGASVLPLIYGWDAYLIPSSRNYFALISHDDFVHIGYRDILDEPFILEWCQYFHPVVIEPEAFIRRTSLA